MEPKRTPLYEKHIQHKAKMVDFAGWLLPLEYSSTLKEAKAARNLCGLFDASHMGEICIEGRAALDFLQRLTSNDISLTKQGQLQYNLLINPQGGIIDDLMIYNKGTNFMCVVNAINTGKVLEWFERNKIGEVTIIDESQDISLMSLQGPKAAMFMEAVLGKPLSHLAYMHFVEEHFQGRNMVISRSGYTGSDGFELYISNKDASHIFDLLMQHGSALGLTLCGLGARDILRVEAGYTLYGHEIDDTTNPLEASLEWAVKLNKEFVGKDKIIETNKAGLKKRRIGFIMEDRIPARQGYHIYANGEFIGYVTSGVYSPNLNAFIGMASVAVEYSKEFTPLEIQIRDKFYRAKVVKFPFIKIETRKSLNRV